MKTLRMIFLAVLAASLCTACGKEEVKAPEASGQDKTYTDVIPVSFEGMDDTKMTLNVTTGVCSWEDNDPIALDTSTGWYYAPVSGGSVRLNLASGQTRTRYATYPAISVQTHDPSPYFTREDDPTVTYPTTYYYNGKSRDWMTAPMIAENTGDQLRFFHVGGVLRVNVTNIASDIKFLKVTFTGMTLTGDFPVTDAGAAEPYTSATTSGNSTLYFYNLTNSENSVYVNVPIPAGDYSHLSAITVQGGTSTYSWSGVYTQTMSFPNGYGTIHRAEGRQLTFDMSGSVSGGDGTIGGKKLYWLKWNSATSKYELFDDSLELLLHNSTEDFDIYWHILYYSQPNSIRQRVLGDALSSVIPDIPIDGRYYHVLTDTELNALLYGSNANNHKNSTVNGNTNQCAIGICVDLNDATPENGAAQDYRMKGAQSAYNSGSVGTGQRYIRGTLILSNNMTINHSLIKTNDNTPLGAISFEFYKKLIDAGCFFFPQLGYWQNNARQNQSTAAIFYDLPSNSHMGLATGSGNYYGLGSSSIYNLGSYYYRGLIIVTEGQK